MLTRTAGSTAASAAVHACSREAATVTVARSTCVAPIAVHVGGTGHPERSTRKANSQSPRKASQPRGNAWRAGKSMPGSTDDEEHKRVDRVGRRWQARERSVRGSVRESRQVAAIGLGGNSVERFGAGGWLGQAGQG